MKLIGYELGRIIVLFPMEELRPNQGVPPHDLVEAVSKRYSFLKKPDIEKSFDQLNKEGFPFEFGSLKYKDETAVIKEFTIYNDGISISCFNTAYADSFLDDVLHWAKQTFGLRDLITKRKIYRSQIVIEFEKSLNHLVENFNELSRLIQVAYAQHTDQNQPLSLNRVDFRMDDTKVPGFTPASFVLERRVGSPHDIERYISEAPLPSDAHLGLLQSLEEKLS